MTSKIANVKSKVRQNAPEILVGLTLIAGIGSLAYINYKMRTNPFQIHIDPEAADSILVLEQVTVDTFKDLDFGDLYTVTPVPQ